MQLKMKQIRRSNVGWLFVLGSRNHVSIYCRYSRCFGDHSRACALPCSLNVTCRPTCVVGCHSNRQLLQLSRRLLVNTTCCYVLQATRHTFRAIWLTV